MAELADLDRMLVEHACIKLVNQYAYASDRGDYVALANMYTEDGLFARPTAPEVPLTSRADILAGFQKRPPSTGRHVMTNTVIEVVSATEATGECYIVLYRGPAPGEDGSLPAMNPVPLVGQFKDRFVKVDGQWLFKERLGSLAYAAG